MDQDRVIVVTPRQKSEVIGVFEDSQSYEEWMEYSEWTESQVNIRDCMVRR